MTLLGDAAHPMYPVGSNGASQAIIDAPVLARELRLRPDVGEALSAYADQSPPSTATAVVLATRRAGPERSMEIVAERAPNGFERLEDVDLERRGGHDRCRLQAHGGFRSRDAQRPPVVVGVHCLTTA